LILKMSLLAFFGIEAFGFGAGLSSLGYSSK